MPAVPSGQTDDDVLLVRGRAVLAALLPTAASGALPAMLLNRHVCVLAEDADSPDSLLFDAAALALGAHVTHLTPARAGLAESRVDAVDHSSTLALLARLYDAIECQGLAAERVRMFAAMITIPVFANLAGRVRAATVGTDNALAGVETHLLMQACLLAACR